MICQCASTSPIGFVHIYSWLKNEVKVLKLTKGKKRSTSIVAALALAATSMFFVGSSPAYSAGNPTIDYAYFTALGWTPNTGSLPKLDCVDHSYANAVKHGYKLGIYDSAPYMYVKDGKETGIDWDINVAVSKYLGITIKPVMLQWPQMIPSLVSRRIDVIGGDIHENPDRLKVIAFSTPAWWYGTTLMTTKANPKGIKTWADLQKPGLKIGVLAGSFIAEWLAKLSPKVNLTLVPDGNTEFQSLVSGKVDVVVDDAPKEGAYIAANPNSNLKILSAATSNPPADFRDPDAEFAFRPADCTLNQAYSRALAQLRDHGVITAILKKYGLGDGDNLYMPAYKP
jgi:polar amino acid transport system substrate-binding protein